MAERDALQAETSLVLIQKRTHDERADALRSEVEALVEERDCLRQERDALVLERDELTQERDALTMGQEALVAARNELEVEETNVQSRREDLSNLDEETSLQSTALGNDLADLMEQKQKLTTELEALSTELDHRRLDLEEMDRSAAAASSEDPNSQGSGFGPDEDEAGTEEAFDRFFDADIDHDKSRDWILG